MSRRQRIIDLRQQAPCVLPSLLLCDFGDLRGEVARLTELYDRWSVGAVAPKWLDPHGANVRKEEAARSAKVRSASRGEK